MRVLVTGGAGFIGSHFVKFALRTHPDWHVINLDKLSYAGNLENLTDLPDATRHQFVKGGIEDHELVSRLWSEGVDIVVNFAATVAVRERALAGVRGRSRLRPAEITVLVLAWVAVVAVMVALAAAGVSYARYPTTVLIVPGLAWAAVTAARAEWRACGVGLAVAAVGGVGLLTGPAGSWLVAGVGLCAVLLGNAAAIAWRQRG